MSLDFRRRIDSMLRDAEFTVASGQPRERLSVNRSHHHRDVNALVPLPEKVAAAYGQPQQNGLPPSSRGASLDGPSWGAASGVDPDPRDPSAAAGSPRRLRPAAGAGAGGATATLASLQAEVDELRRELRAEREGRDALLSAVVRRVKEEMRSEAILAARETEGSVAEMNAQLRSRVADVEATANACARRCDEVTRAVKVCGSDVFELSEQTNEAVSGLRSQVEAAVALAAGTRTDCARSVEKERVALQHRLEVELARFAEADRQQRQAVEQVRERMAEEVRRLGGTVDDLVAKAWETRAKAFIGTVNEALDTVKAQSRTVTQSLAESASRVDQLGKQVRTLQALDTHVFEQRMAGLENVVPNLSSRVDRTEKRSEALLDSNSRLTASVDVLREAADRAAAHAVRCVERLQSFEGTLADRDSRLVSVESALVHVQGAERVKSELEAVKRSMGRVESIADAMRSNGQRDERAVEALERAVDTLQSKTEGMDSRLGKTAAKCDALEQRVQMASERAMAVDAAVDRIGTSVQQHASELATSVGVLSRRSDGIEAKVATQLEQHEAVVADVRNRAMQVEATCNAMRISVEAAAQSAAAARGESDKLLRKVSTLEATAGGLADFAARADHQQREREQQQQASRFDEVRLENLTTQINQLRGRLDAVAKQANNVEVRQEQMAAMRAPSPNAMGSRGGSGMQAAEVDELQAALSRLKTATEQLQSSNVALRSQVASIEGRVAVLDERSASKSPSGSGMQQQQPDGRVDALEQTMRVVKSQANLSSQRVERVEAVLSEVEQRLGDLEDNFARVAQSGGVTAPASSSSAVSANKAASSTTTAAAAAQQQPAVAVVAAAPRVVVSSGGGMMAPEPTPRSAVSGVSPMSSQAADSPPSAHRGPPVGGTRSTSPSGPTVVGGRVSPHGTVSPRGTTAPTGAGGRSVSPRGGGPAVAAAPSPLPRPQPQLPQQQQQQQPQPQPQPKKDTSAVSQIVATVDEAWRSGKAALDKAGGDPMARRDLQDRFADDGRDVVSYQSDDDLEEVVLPDEGVARPAAAKALRVGMTTHATAPYDSTTMSASRRPAAGAGTRTRKQEGEDDDEEEEEDEDDDRFGRHAKRSNQKRGDDDDDEDDGHGFGRGTPIPEGAFLGKASEEDWDE